ncbi:MAG: PDZ domain-containing protein [Anaerolineales bacterium]|nr:PDZ domain-containing protein [Anaerolineales bacterium]
MVTTLDKQIVYIGSDPGRDVFLDPLRGSGVSPLHAQLIFSAEVAGCRLVNLGSTEIGVAENVLPPQGMLQLPGETTLKIGEFTLIFHAGMETLLDLPSAGKNIAIAVSLPFTRLEPGRSLSGSIRVRNQGDQGGVQVDVDIEGLDPACYTIEPGPVLSAGTEKEVAFRIYHRGNQPPAGLRQITIRSTALRAYSGEEVSVTQSIQVLPSYAYEMELLPPGAPLPAIAKPGTTLRREEMPQRALASIPTAPIAPLTPPSRKMQPYQEIWEAAQPVEHPPEAVSLPLTQEKKEPPEPTSSTEPSPAKIPTAPPARVYLGMQCIPLTPSIIQAMNLPAGQRGMLVVQITPHGPADQAGLQPGEQNITVDGYQLTINGDVITAWDNQPVSSIENLQTLLLQSSPEQVVTLDILRKGQARQVSLTLGSQAATGGATPTIISLSRKPETTTTQPLPSARDEAPTLTATSRKVSHPIEKTAPKKPTTRHKASAPSPPSQSEATSPALPPAEKRPPARRPAKKTPAIAKALVPPAQETKPVQLPAKPSIPTAMPAIPPSNQATPASTADVPRKGPQPEEPQTVEQTLPIDDWWSPITPSHQEAGKLTAEQETPVVKIKATHPTKPVVSEKAPAELLTAEKLREAPLASKTKHAKTDDWWGKEIKTLADSAEVIQLKASASKEDESEGEEET